MRKRTQANKLAAVLEQGSLSYDRASPNGKKVFRFTPNAAGHDRYGIPAIEMEVHSPFEVVDVVYFEYLQRGENGVQK